MAEDKSLLSLSGVQQATAARLANLGIHKIFDLIFHFPLRYQDRTHLTPIVDLLHGSEALVQGQIVESRILFYGARPLQVIIQDKSGLMKLKFFYHGFAIKKTMKVGKHVRAYGQVRLTATGAEFYHPECTIIQPDEHLDEALTPVYPLTQGISQRKMRSIIRSALGKTQDKDLPELINLADMEIPTQTELNKIKSSNDDSANNSESSRDNLSSDLSILQCLKLIHSPPPSVDLNAIMEGVHPAQFKLALEEITAHRLYLLREKQNSDEKKAYKMPPVPHKWQDFVKTLPFAPTAGQEQACNEISKDLAEDRQMVRLLQGDVGCGKTLVAAFAAHQAISGGWQCVIMAPTEILAEQHLDKFTEWFLPLGICIVPLIGKMTAKAKKEQYEIIANGAADLIIGTHALFQEKVSFAKLGLIIVDEQQRFGVKQRHSLMEKGMASGGGIFPHQLIMSATPIPRTLAQTIMANMDISSINDMPPGRIPCETTVINRSKRQALVSRLRPQLAKGAQVYWVCPLIDESAEINAENIASIEKELRGSFPEYKLAIAHGRQKADVKSQAMLDFKNAKAQILLATTVIEVGVDVPNANFMVIENAERMGLSQLHQLRGRVGRGGEKSYCILVFREPLTVTAKERLQTMQKTNSGFIIAEADLRLRGAGEVIGTRQSGAMQFKVADLFRHKSIINQSQVLSNKMLEMPEDQQQMLINRWINQSQAFSSV